MKAWTKWKPPPKLTISEWADEYRRLSSEASAEPGKWRTDRAPFQREMMDACLSSQDVVIMSSAQVGKSEAIYNIIGYHIHYDPCPMLFVFPTIEMAEDQSKSRVATMIRDTPAITELFSSKSKTSANTLRNKAFPGGYLALAGANSPASLASRPVRMVLCDEVDRFPISAGTEGDPVNLAFKRTTTFWNRRRIIVSTPTIKGASRIEIAYENSDQRKYFVPCPHCNEMQELKWSNVRWEKDHLGIDLPDTAIYMCDHCGATINDAERLQMQKFGEWRKMNPKNTKVAGFHINQLYSPWSSLSSMVNDFVLAKDNPELLKTWVNTTLGESFEEILGDKLNTQAIQARAENYNEMTVPEGAYIVTAGVDVQDNRLSVLIEAWGQKEESWIVYWGELMGDPAYTEVWEKLDHLLSNGVEHVRGIKLPISAVAIDSGGHHTQTVYNFCRNNKYKYHIFPIKGSSTPNRPIFSRPSKVDLNYKGKTVKNGVELFIVGTDTAKSYIYSCLSKSKHDEHGRYTHFYNALPEDFYEQLTSERRVIKYVNGFPKPYWHKDQHQRNEALDCKVYSLVASHYVGIPRLNWDKIKFQFEERIKNEAKKEVKPVENKEEIQEPKREVNKITPPRVKRRGDNWATSW